MSDEFLRGRGDPASERCSRRLALGAGLALLGVGRRARAEEVSVPPKLQAELLSKIAGYDRNMAARAGDRVRIGVAMRPGDASSERTAALLVAALEKLPEVGGLPHESKAMPYEGAGALVEAVRGRRLAVVYLATGFEGETEAIRKALDGVDVLSVSAVAEQVPRGIVLGFDLIEGRTKMLVHLGQAKRQNVAFKAEMLKLAKVFE